jgi:hypothetical protein
MVSTKALVWRTWIQARMPVQMTTDHDGDVLLAIDLGAHHIGYQNLAQLLAMTLESSLRSLNNA